MPISPPRPPAPDGQMGLRALRAMWQHQNMLAALELFHRELGDIFRVNLPGFDPIVLVGPEANRFVLIAGRDDLRWRIEGDPITRLLRDGLLVIDGDWHDTLRSHMNPAFHRRLLTGYVEAMWRYTDQISAAWANGDTIEMLAEMRRVALLILVETMFGVDFTPQMARLWPAVLRALQFISPGLWLIWRNIPRPGYTRYLRQVDDYLYGLIQARRTSLAQTNTPPTDLLSTLLTTPGLNDEVIRDQMLTMLIAGHDTSTALLGWAFYLLGSHPDVLSQAQAEVDAILGLARPDFEHAAHLSYLDNVINEALRLYPPLHIGNRTAALDLEFQGYRIPAGSRVLYSPYLTHRQPQYWPHPYRFDPSHFAPESSHARLPYSFVPFGGGSRICLGAAFAQVEVKIILARVLQTFNLELTQPQVHLHMGVTLEPRPGVLMRVQRRRVGDH